MLYAEYANLFYTYYYAGIFDAGLTNTVLIVYFIVTALAVVYYM